MSYFHAEIVRISVQICLRIGTSLAEFYKQCSFLPSGMGSQRAMASYHRNTGFAEDIINPDFEGGTPLQYDVGKSGSKLPWKHNDALTSMQSTYGRRAIRQRSISSSYCSSSSATSSPPPADYETTNRVIFPFIDQIPSMGHVNKEDMLISPSTSSYIEATPGVTAVNSLNQLDILLNQMHGIDVHGSTAVSPINYQLNNPEQYPAPSHGDPTLSDLALYFSSTNMASVSEDIDTQYLRHSQNQPNDDQNYFYESVNINDNLDDFHSLEAYPQAENKAAGGLVQLVSQFSASQSGDPQHQWGKLFTNADIEGVRVTNLFRQPTVHEAHALPRALFSGGTDHSLGAPDHMRIQDQGAAALAVDEAERSSTETIGYSLANKNDQKKPIILLSAAGSLIASAYNRRGFKPWMRSLSNQHRLKKKSINREGSELIKHVLRTFLPRLRAEMVRMRGSGAGMMDMQKVQQYNMNIGRGSGEVLQAATGDHQNAAGLLLQNEAAVQHMFAERNRRRKQHDCFEALRNLVPNINKKDKVAILERTIEYIKEIQGGVCELEQEKVESFGHHHIISNLTHPISEKNSSQSINLQPMATCHYVPSLNVNHSLPHFGLNLSMTIKDSKSANDLAIEIISALQQKNLHCIEFNLKFDMPTNNFNASITAMYKDGENFTPPSLDKIQEIKEWWRFFVQDDLNPMSRP